MKYSTLILGAALLLAAMLTIAPKWPGFVQSTLLAGPHIRSFNSDVLNAQAHGEQGRGDGK